MFNLFILLSLMLSLALLCYLCNDITLPPIVLNVAWIMPVLVLILAEGIKGEVFNLPITALIFPAGLILFIVGFVLTAKKIYRNPSPIIPKVKLHYKLLIKILIIFELIIAVAFFIRTYRYVMSHYQYNFWFTYKWNVSMGYFEDWFFIPYVRTMSRALLCVMFVAFLSRTNKKKDNKWLYLQAIITIIFNVLGQGRGAVFSTAIPLLFIFIWMRRKSNIYIIKIFIRAVVILLTIFIIYSILKAPYIEQGKSQVLLSLENYFCGSIIAFSNWAMSSHEYAYGLYTFRFFCAILQALGLDVTVVSMVEPYTSNIHGNIGNVYTVYKWYANDFGITYAVIIQFVLGAIYGIVYKKFYKKRTPFWIVMYALLFYSLIMQFFMDEYSTMLSVWIQYIFWLFIFTKTKLFFRKEVINIDDSSRNCTL